MKNTDWQRVTRENPCPVCERPDWCLTAGPPDNPTAAICPRTESEHHIEGAGWLHRLRDDNWPDPGQSRRQVAVKFISKPAKDRPNFETLTTQYESALSPNRLRWLANDLGLPAETLRQFRVGWCEQQQSYSFPMSNGEWKVTGIRLRRPGGFKFAEKGSDGNGLFLPTDPGPPDPLFILEGPTDAAAAVALGFAAIGRPSCFGGKKHLYTLVRRSSPDNVVIIADADGPGRKGAEQLANALATLAAVRVIQPPEPHKDMRAWYKAGATIAEVERLIDSASVRRVDITTRKVRRRRPRKGNR